MIWRKLWTIANRIQGAAYVAALCFCATVSAAQDLVLTSKQGALTVEGRFIGYDGTYLQVETSYGLLTLLYDNMTCVGAACPAAQGYVPTFRLSGAAKMTTVLMPGLLEGFARAQGYALTTTQGDAVTLADADGDVARFVFHASTTAEGFADLTVHEADLVLAARAVLPDEVTRADEVGIGKLDHPQQRQIIGLDPVIFVGPAAPGRVDLQEMAALHVVDNALSLFFEGTATTLHDTREAFDRALLEDGAVGAISLSARRGGQAKALLDQCGYLSVPDEVGFKTLNYPFANPIHIYSPERRPHPVLQAFLRWIDTADAAQRVIRRAGFVNQELNEVPMGAQGERLANAIRSAGAEVPLGELQRMLRVLEGHTRMTLNFRFEDGSTRLDALSMSGLRRLARAILNGDFDGQDIMLVGFTDGRGAAGANRDLSSARAEEVKRRLVMLIGDRWPDSVTIQTAAFGEALPVACDDTERGRKTNRRVELWVGQGG